MGCNPQDVEGWLFAAAKEDYVAACTRGLPSSLYKPRLFQDGDRWCALFGDNVQEGVCGFGASPYEAYADFDRAWCAKIEPKK